MQRSIVTRSRGPLEDYLLFRMVSRVAPPTRILRPALHSHLCDVVFRLFTGRMCLSFFLSL